MAINPVPIDSNHKTQTIDQPERRTIYDAKTSEIAWKSFVAGISLGMGQMFATLIFFSIIVSVFIAFVQPWLTRTFETIQRYIPASLIQQQQPRNTNPTFQLDSQQLLQMFGSPQPTNSPQNESEPADSFTTTQ